MAGLYAQKYSPARAPSPHHHHHLRTISLSTQSSLSAASSSSDVVDSEYLLLLSELLGEHQKLAPFTQVLPICSRLLNQDILRVSGMFTNQQGCFPNFQDRMQCQISPRPMPMPMPDIIIKQQQQQPNFREPPQGIIMDWQQSPPPPSTITKRILRLDIPLDTYHPSILPYQQLQFNFVGRLLGPRGNSLKRVEASTGCRVFIRGKGSIKDAAKEETLRGRPGYEHLNHPLHILIEAELPLSIVDLRLTQAKQIIQQLLKPVEESQDFYKRQQLRELAMLNSNIREETPQPQPQARTSVSPFSSSGMKRAKTGQ